MHAAGVLRDAVTSFEVYVEKAREEVRATATDAKAIGPQPLSVEAFRRQFEYLTLLNITDHSFRSLLVSDRRLSRLAIRHLVHNVESTLVNREGRVAKGNHHPAQTKAASTASGLRNCGYGFNRQPRVTRATAATNAALATTAATRSEIQGGDSWNPVSPARVASTR